MPQTLPVTITVIVDAALQFTPATLPHGIVGQPYPPTTIGTVSGGTAPYTFSVISGLPVGMVLSAAGVLSGTPTVAGTSAVQVSVTDSGT